jgi:hypothetical protein
VLGFATAICETIDILKEITRKMMMYFENLDTHKQEYFDDPDDPPIPRIGEMLIIVKCENYMTCRGLIEFNLEYMLFRINIKKKFPSFDYTQKALEEIPEIPANEYVWYFCPLEIRTVDIQIVYYLHWQRFDDNNKVSKKEISDIIKKGLHNNAKDKFNLVINTT